jgi:16S rRNA (adenine1518-N6/adenine1519-N6)-dimethyltransferase
VKRKRGRGSFSGPRRENEPRPLFRARFPARKRFAQHFLTSVWAERVVAAIDPQPGDAFLEIGPGTGSITLPLAATGSPIVAVELDRDLVRLLTERVPPNVTVIGADFLDLDPIPVLRGLEPQRLPGALESGRSPFRFRAVGNLPYNVASRIVLRLVEFHRRQPFFADATVMLQREVADRLLGRPGTKAYGVLTILTTFHARVTRLLDLPPGAFLPRPKVHSTVVRLTFGPPAARVTDERRFERMVKAMFSQRRKTLGNALKGFHRQAAAALRQAGLDPKRRPETLQVTEIARLAETLAAIDRPPML